MELEEENKMSFYSKKSMLMNVNACLMHDSCFRGNPGILIICKKNQKCEKQKAKQLQNVVTITSYFIHSRETEYKIFFQKKKKVQ